MKKLLPLLILGILLISCGKEDSLDGFNPITGVTVEGASAVKIDQVSRIIGVYYYGDPGRIDLSKIKVDFQFDKDAYMMQPFKATSAVMDLSGIAGNAVIVQKNGIQIIYVVRAYTNCPFYGVYAKVGSRTAITTIDRGRQMVFLSFDEPAVDLSKVEVTFSMVDGTEMAYPSFRKGTMDMTDTVYLKSSTPTGEVTYKLMADNVEFVLPTPSDTWFRYRRPSAGAMLYMADRVDGVSNKAYMLAIDKYRLGHLPVFPRDTVFRIQRLISGTDFSWTGKLVCDRMTFSKLGRGESEVPGYKPYKPGPLHDDRFGEDFTSLKDSLWIWKKPWAVMNISGEEMFCVSRSHLKSKAGVGDGQPGFAVDRDGRCYTGTISAQGDTYAVGDCQRPWWAIQGRYLLISGGVNQPLPDEPARACSAIGCRRDGHLLLFVCEKQWVSKGLTPAQMQKVMADWGCVDAMAFEGGPTANLCLQGTGENSGSYLLGTEGASPKWEAPLKYCIVIM